jgi:hypothetical protein
LHTINSLKSLVPHVDLRDLREKLEEFPVCGKCHGPMGVELVLGLEHRDYVITTDLRRNSNRDRVLQHSIEQASLSSKIHTMV